MDKRQIDALVAEALGLDVYKGHIFVIGPISCPDNIPGCLVAHSGPIAYVLPYYSIDIAAAMEIIAWMTSKGWHFGLSGSIAEDEEPSSIWHASFSAQECGSGTSDTIPEAICLAFLKAMGVEVNNAD